MAESLYSPSWYRVAELKPRLRGHVQVRRHYYREQLWYVLQDPASGRHHRLNPPAHFLISLMDGARTVQSIWDSATAELGDDAPTQDETIQLLGQLHATDVLQCDVPPDTLEIFRRQDRQQRMKWKQRFWNPLVLRFPLVDPDRFLARWLWLVRPLFGWFGAIAWSTAVTTAIVLVGAHWQELSSNAAERILATQNLFLLFLIYPVVKALHELGHAFATKIWGGEVHEMGITLLVLMPVAYVDASFASGFRDKRQRMAVGAAGIFVELFLAALALFVWLNVESGVVRDIAYNVILIGGISTILFNGNPLLRFDGYYVLADAIDIPNLAGRSQKYIGYLIERYVFGVREATSPATAPGERTWFVLYGVASFVYRMAIMFVIIVFIAGKFFVVGVLLAIWAIFTQLIVPAAKRIAFLFTNPRIRRQRVRALTTSGLTLAALLVLIVFLPVPSWTRAEGVVWLPEESYVRAGTDGFIRRVIADPDGPVRTGDPLIECEDPLLSARVKVLESRLRERRARYNASRVSDRVQAELMREEIAAVEAELSQTRERAAELIIRAPTDGKFVVPRIQDLPGRFVEQGELIAYVLDRSVRTVRVVVSQADVDLVRRQTQVVEVRLAERMAEVMPVMVQREVPAAIHRLPSKALASTGGGRIPVDPRDEEGVRTLQTIFQFDVTLPAHVRAARVGGRAYVRFDHGGEPLARQWYRALRQLFLSHFHV
ncbi:MAG: PqqD family peptide modification chaperone [Acidiferrobacterales bacterium]